MINGNLVTLSKPNREHMPLLSSWRNTPEFRKYYREYRDGNLEDQFHWFDHVLMKDPTWHHFIARPNDNPEKIIGVAFLNHIHPIYRTGEFGITLADENYRGKGIATAAVALMLEAIKKNKEIVRIEAKIFGGNGASARVLEKNNFVLEGTRKNAIYKNGVIADEQVWVYLVA
jgi:RimJ/RimL family protein N-acetyltransferase